MTYTPRQQLDNHDDITLRTGLRCPPEENMTRQEFAEEADINNIVARFYPFAPPMSRAVQFGEQDMSLDLHSAMLAVQDAKDAYQTLPESLRSQYPTYSDFVSAVADGRLQIVNQDAAGVEVSSTPEGSSASESAPVKATDA